jgi:hypothetical protein
VILITPAGTITGPDMAVQIVARVYGPQWTEPYQVFEDRGTGQITSIQGPADPEAAMRMLDTAYERLLIELRNGTLTAELEVDQRRLGVPAAYWASGSGQRGIREGKLYFTGGAAPHLWHVEGRVFFVSRSRFLEWLDGFAPSSTTTETASLGAPSRGRPPIQRARVVAEMVERYRHRPELLKSTKQEALAQEFRTSAKTVRSAKPLALCQIVPNSAG